MITLKGVIILRISDFRRFFDFGEFWFKKEDFFKLFKQEINRRVESPTKPIEEYFFVNNKKEFCLLQKVYDWLTNPSKELLKVKLNATEVIIEANDGELLVYPLGRLKDYIEDAKKQNQLTKKSILGYTLLYLLLNANEHNSDISINFPSNTSSLSIKDFNRCWNDVVLESITTIEFPLRRCVFVNANPIKDIKIKLENKTLVLHKNDSVIGVFCGNKCYKLLPNSLTNSDKEITLKLKSNSVSNVITLEIHKPDKIEKIDDVVSIGIDSNGKPVYMRSDGKIYFESKNFTIQQQYEGFIKQYDISEAIALEVSHDFLNIFMPNNIYG